MKQFGLRKVFRITSCGRLGRLCCDVAVAVIAIVAAGCAATQNVPRNIPGWRIYSPPATPSYPLGNVSVPLSQWNPASDTVYPSALDCEVGAKKFSNKSDPRVYDCVANDDLRLKSNRAAQVADSDH